MFPSGSLNHAAFAPPPVPGVPSQLPNLSGVATTARKRRCRQRVRIRLPLTIEMLAHYRRLLDERGWDWGDDQVEMFRWARFEQARAFYREVISAAGQSQNQSPEWCGHPGRHGHRGRSDQ